MTLLECWRIANELVVTDHAIERYLERTLRQPPPPGADIIDLVRAEFLTGWGGRRHVPILDEGYTRLIVIWKSEPLVSLIRPWSAEGAGTPCVLTILTDSMFAKSLNDGRFIRRKAA